MLMTEWDWDKALAAYYEDGKEDGREEGREQIARNALAEGASFEFVQKITGLDMETIQSFK